MKGLFFLIVTSIFNIAYSQTIIVRSLNDCGVNDINKTVTVLRNLYSFDITIVDKYNFKEKNGSIDCDDLNQKISNNKRFEYNPNKPINIFLTNSDLLIKKNIKVRGVCYGNNIYINSKSKRQIKTTLVHELSHTFGLKHCENICIMNIKYNPDHINMIWNGKINKPVFCGKCKEQLKNIKMSF